MSLRLFLQVKEPLLQPMLRLDLLPLYQVVHLDLPINNTLSGSRPNSEMKHDEGKCGAFHRNASPHVLVGC
jgi:hypothetical protein